MIRHRVVGLPRVGACLFRGVSITEHVDPDLGNN
jgi:hypothetical protein